jgi:hypothetical protein
LELKKYKLIYQINISKDNTMKLDLISLFLFFCFSMISCTNMSGQSKLLLKKIKQEQWKFLEKKYSDSLSLYDKNVLLTLAEGRKLFLK